jgi:hypothetical protein
MSRAITRTHLAKRITHIEDVEERGMDKTRVDGAVFVAIPSESAVLMHYSRVPRLTEFGCKCKARNSPVGNSWENVDG